MTSTSTSTSVAMYAEPVAQIHTNRSNAALAMTRREAAMMMMVVMMMVV